MKKNLILLLICTTIFSALCSLTQTNAQNSFTYKQNVHHKCPYRPFKNCLRESVQALKENGTLSEDDVKNIEAHMKKERESKEAEMKEKIYNSECMKIDKMVEEKIITKEQGQKLKSTVKENINTMEINRKNKED